MKKALVAGSLGIMLLAAIITPASAMYSYYVDPGNGTRYYTGYRDTSNSIYSAGYANYYSWYNPGYTYSWNYNWNRNYNYNANYNYNRNWNYNYNTNQNSGGTVCTMEYRYGLLIYLQDEAGQPITGATVTATRNGQAVNDFQSFQNGQYSGLGEGNGHYNITIQRAGYSTHRETVRLERDNCHVIQQIRTITLYQ